VTVSKRSVAHGKHSYFILPCKHHPGAALRLPPSTIEQAFSLLDISADSVTHPAWIHRVCAVAQAKACGSAIACAIFREPWVHRVCAFAQAKACGSAIACAIFREPWIHRVRAFAQAKACGSVLRRCDRWFLAKSFPSHRRL